MTIILLISILLFIICLFLFIFTVKIRTDKTEQIKEEENKLNELLNQIEQYNKEINEIQQKKESEELTLNNLTNSLVGKSKEYATLAFQIQDMQEKSQNSVEYFQNITENAKKEFFSKVDKDYNLKLQEFKKSKEQLDNQINLLNETLRARTNLQQQERKIKENLKDYTIPCSAKDKADIKQLEQLRETLNNPRILNMLIWQTYYQKPLTTLCNKMFGAKSVTGIYKITNQKNNMCYIGQSLNIATRWKEHCKCGCGIDTPAGNKLYAAMLEDEIWNFSFELLEECPADKLNEKEKEYIDIYDSKINGYNSTIGNK